MYIEKKNRENRENEEKNFGQKYIEGVQYENCFFQN
jgi:hypothetical protein